MVIPVPATAVGVSPPRGLITTMTYVFSTILLLELVVSSLRFYILDIWGGVIMTLITVFGAFLVKYEFDLQWTVMFGITIFFYGLIHFVMFLERLILNWGSFPTTSTADMRLLVKDMVFIVSPIVDWTLCGLCVFIFRKSIYGERSGGGSTYAERQPLTGGSSVRNSNSAFSSRQGGSSFTPFSGQGHKLS